MTLKKASNLKLTKFIRVVVDGKIKKKHTITTTMSSQKRNTDIA